MHGRPEDVLRRWRDGRWRRAAMLVAGLSAAAVAALWWASAGWWVESYRLGASCRIASGWRVPDDGVVLQARLDSPERACAALDALSHQQCPTVEPSTADWCRKTAAKPLAARTTRLTAAPLRYRIRPEHRTYDVFRSWMIERGANQVAQGFARVGMLNVAHLLSIGGQSCLPPAQTDAIELIDSAGGACLAFPVDDRILVTAGHCLAGGDEDSVTITQPVALDFYCARSSTIPGKCWSAAGTQNLAKACNVTAAYRTDPNCQKDIAVCWLDKPLPASCTVERRAVATAAPASAPHPRVQVVSKGAFEDSYDLCVKYDTGRVQGTWNWPGPMIHLLAPDPVPDNERDRLHFAPGDSGGPVTRFDKTQVQGIHVAAPWPGESYSVPTWAVPPAWWQAPPGSSP